MGVSLTSGSNGSTPPLAVGQYIKRMADGAVFQYQGLVFDLLQGGPSQSALSALLKPIHPTGVVPYAHINFHEFLRRCLRQEFILVTKTESGTFVALPNA